MLIKDKCCVAAYVDRLDLVRVMKMAADTRITDGFEEVVLTEPRKALDQAGADTRVVSPKGDEVHGWNFTDWGHRLPVELKLE
jgi:putative intracellular protease/amidase